MSHATSCDDPVHQLKIIQIFSEDDARRRSDVGPDFPAVLASVQVTVAQTETGPAQSIPIVGLGNFLNHVAPRGRTVQQILEGMGSRPASIRRRR